MSNGPWIRHLFDSSDDEHNSSFCKLELSNIESNVKRSVAILVAFVFGETKLINNNITDVIKV